MPSDLNINVLIEVFHQPAKFKLDKRLSRLLGADICTKNQFITLIWQYISLKKLQDISKPYIIKFDKHLQSLLGIASVPIIDLIQSFTKFMFKIDPIVINHSIKSGDLQTVVIDNDQPLVIV